MTAEPRTLDLGTLRSAIAGDAAAFRSVTELQPAGGPGDKVFPPTYEGAEYALEERVIDGRRVKCVLLDSVQSQANRLELALLDGYRQNVLRFPLVQLYFSGVDDQDVRDIGVLTALEAPHRIADALFRWSEVEEGGKRRPFRDGDASKASSWGQRLERAAVANATALFELCPTALVFGMWDSHGPRGGLGEKFQRALVSEIVGLDAEVGVRPTSRIDPVIRTTRDLPIERTRDGWKLVDKGKSKLSEIGLGNVTPSLRDDKSGELRRGGVTIASARQIAVLSLPALRRLRFPVNRGGKPAHDEGVGVAARTALAALALAALSWQWRAGFDLRSRCLLVPQHGLRLELLGAGSAEVFRLPTDVAAALLREAATEAVNVGLPWPEEPLTLVPGEELTKVVRRSRLLAAEKS